MSETIYGEKYEFITHFCLIIILKSQRIILLVSKYIKKIIFINVNSHFYSKKYIKIKNSNS